MTSIIIAVVIFVVVVVYIAGTTALIRKQAKKIAMYEGWNERLESENRKLKQMANVDFSDTSEFDLDKLLS